MKKMLKKNKVCFIFKQIILYLYKQTKNMKYVILNSMSIYADSVEEAETVIKQLQNNKLITQDADTKIISVEEGIEDKDKIYLDGYHGAKIITCIGHEIRTKYGETYTVKDWNPNTKTLGFEETKDRLHESRISSGSYVIEDDEY